MQGSKVMDEAEVARLTEQVAQLEEALDAARRLLATRVEATRLDEANAEVTRLTEAPAAAERDCVTNAETAEEYLREYKAAEARVRELEALQRADRADCNRWHSRAVAAESEVARLTEALAAAEQQLESFGESTMRLLARAEAAERARDENADARDMAQQGWSDALARDAANRLLVRAKGQLQAFAHTTISRAALMTDLDAHLSSQPAVAKFVREILGEHCFIDANGVAHPAQPAAPTRTETPELRPGCTRADYYEPTRTEGNYSLAELRRIIRAEPGSLTGAELVVRDAMLEMCTSRAGAELTALRRRVARATAALTRNHVARALDALRGR